MNGTSAFQEERSSPPHHQRIGSCMNSCINSGKVPDNISSFHTDNNPSESSNIFTMHASLVFILGLLLIGTSAGCSFFTPPASQEKLDSKQSYWFHYEAARRGGFLVSTDATGKSNVKMCAEPAPDVALARTAEFIAKGTYQGATAEAQAKLSEQLAQLGGRTEIVLILRESLFRLCELSINSDLSAAQLEVLYLKVVAGVVDLVKTDLKKAEVDETKAATELANAQAERMRIFKLLPPDSQQKFTP